MSTFSQNGFRYSDYDINSNASNAFHNIYGSITDLESIKPEEITHPEIVSIEEESTQETKFKNEENGKGEEINDEKASKYEIIKKLNYIGEKKINSSFISELKNGYLIVSRYDDCFLLYDNSYRNVLKIKFPLIINSFYELNAENSEHNDNNIIKILCFSICYIYIISYDLKTKKGNIETLNIKEYSEKEDNTKDKKDNKIINNYHSMLNLKSNKDILFTNYGVSLVNNLLNGKERNEKIIIQEQYIEGISLNSNLICLKSNILYKNGLNELICFDLNDNKIIKRINDYSFTVSPFRLKLVERNEFNKVLICACTKYSSEQKNGILIVNFDLKNKDKIDTKIKFEDTNSFSVNCICHLNINEEEKENNNIYLLAGGVDDEYNKGVMKLFIINIDEDEINIEFLQNIDIDDNIEGSISYIFQLKNGKIIVSSGSGNILCSSPNLEGYNEELF